MEGFPLINSQLFMGYEHRLQDLLGRKEQELRTKYHAFNQGNVQEPESKTRATTNPVTEDEHDAEKRPVDLNRFQIEEDISHLRCLLGFIETDLGHLKKLRSQARDGTLETVAYENVWHLFDRGGVVLTSSEDGTQAYRVEDIGGCQVNLEAELEPFSRLDLGCFSLHFDGFKIRPRRVDLDIMPYHREKRISELDVYPARFHENAKDHLAMLMHRGLRYRDICLRDVPGHKTYNGATIEKYPEIVHGEVYVDFEAYPQDVLIDRRHRDDEIDFAPPRRIERVPPPPRDYGRFDSRSREPIRAAWKFPDEWVDDELGETTSHWKNKQVSRKIDPQDVFETDEERLQLLPLDVPAYVFRSRAWRTFQKPKKYNILDANRLFLGRLDVCILKEMDYNEKAGDRGFEQLVIPESHRNLLLALVNNHPSGPKNHGEMSRPVNLEMDLVKGKGTGLIILLHGPPGVGKTSTAETIAAYTRRPLYPITCGDLGTTPKEVEESLAKHFSLAHRWGCVLLLDEADVFLAKRDRDDVVRNGLVSGEFTAHWIWALHELT